MILNWIIFLLSIPVLFFAARALVDTVNPRTKAAMILDKMLDRSVDDAEKRLHRSMLWFTVHEIEEENRRGSVDS